MTSPSNLPPSIREREKTVLFAVGYIPYKVTLWLSPRTSYSVGDVNEAVGRQLPDQGKGIFMIVASTKELQVGVFRYDKTTGCSKPGNKLLPRPKCRHRMMNMLMRKPDIRVASRFLYNGYDHQYNIDDKGSIYALMECVPPSEPYHNEDVRSSQMIQDLKLTLSEHYTVDRQGGDFSRHCPFSGEGDLSIFKSTCSAAVVNLHPNNEIPPDDDICDTTKVSPTKPGEYRCVSIENKVAGNLGREVEQ